MSKILEKQQNSINIKLENLKLKEEILELKNIILEKEKKIFEYEKNILIKNENSKTISKNELKNENNYENIMSFRAKLNKKEILKNKIINLIEENGSYLSEICFLFVSHHKLSSKATFYNYLKELEIKNEISIKRENSKNVIYKNSYTENEKKEFQRVKLNYKNK